MEDKNIGPCVANRKECKAEMINQHFENVNVHDRISKEQAQELMNEAIIIFFKTIICTSKKNKSKRCN